MLGSDERNGYEKILKQPLRVNKHGLVNQPHLITGLEETQQYLSVLDTRQFRHECIEEFFHRQKWFYPKHILLCILKFFPLQNFSTWHCPGGICIGILELIHIKFKGIIFNTVHFGRIWRSGYC